MVDIKALKAKFIIKDITVVSLAKALNLTQGTIYRRLAENGETFTINEVHIISELLELTDQEIISIFFCK